MIGPDVTVGNHCKFQNNLSVSRGVTIEDGVFCRPSCVLTQSAEIERIAAGAMVTRGVPACALMVGSPVRRVGRMSRTCAKLGIDLVCTIDGSRYREVGNRNALRTGQSMAEVASKSQTGEPIAFIDLQAQRRRIGDRIGKAMAAVLEHGQFILGPEVAQLEKQLAAHCGAKHAVCCSSGTDALVLALMALEVGPGDAVFVPSFTFAATAEAVALVGATPVFVDIVAETCNMDAASLEDAIAMVKKESQLKPVGVIAVDMYGQTADVRAIKSVADPRNLWIMEDGAQSYGATLDGRSMGTLTTISTTSFFPAKPLGCYGDGGAVFTNDDRLASLVRSLLFHGKGADKYDNVRIGMNGRLDTIQAAILIEKLAIFDDEMVMREQVAAGYTRALGNFAQIPVLIPGATSAWAQYTLAFENRDAVASRLKQQGIPTAVYYPKPLHQQTAYRSYPLAPRGLPVSDRMAKTVLSVPMHPYLDSETQGRISEAVRMAIN
jgi:dTDP-4-amino-4,6-dideoxygalactose transaminase